MVLEFGCGLMLTVRMYVSKIMVRLMGEDGVLSMVCVCVCVCACVCMCVHIRLVVIVIVINY